MTPLEELKARIGAGVATEIGDTLLQQYLDNAAAEYASGGRVMQVDLAASECWFWVAAKLAGGFKFSDASIAVDKSMTSANYLALAKQIWDRYGITGRSKADIVHIGVRRRGERCPH